MHHHGSSCSHHPAPTRFHKAFAIGIILNSVFVAIEFFYGHYARSLSLVADAVHNLGDILGLIVAWLGYALAQRTATARHTLGYGRMSIYATVFNAVFLVISSVWIIVEALERFATPQAPATGIVAIVALVGIIINTGTALALARGNHDINIKGAFLHMLGDAAVSAAVVIAALVMGITGWIWIDPVLSTGFALLILWSAWPLLKEGFHLAMDGVPYSLKTEEIQEFISNQQGVVSVHDLRIWALSTTKTALAAHIVITPEHSAEAVLQLLRHELQHDFDLSSVTLQIEHDHKSC